jgi:hypothetical protein
MADSTAPSQSQRDGGPDITGGKEDGNAKLSEAAENGGVEEVIRCLDRGEDVIEKNRDGEARLYAAVQ